MLEGTFWWTMEKVVNFLWTTTIIAAWLKGYVEIKMKGAVYRRGSMVRGRWRSGFCAWNMVEEFHQTVNVHYGLNLLLITVSTEKGYWSEDLWCLGWFNKWVVVRIWWGVRKMKERIEMVEE